MKTELKKPTFEELETTLEELVKMGLLQDSGRRRQGQIVWELTPLGALEPPASDQYN